MVEQVRRAESALGAGEALTRAVAHNYHRVLAVKDEWEVARLYSHPDFQASLEREFEGDFRLRFHLGAWPFAKTDANTGKTQKAEIGPWVLKAFGLMADLKSLRGSWFDPFKNNEERQLDQRLLAQYEADVAALLPVLSAGSLPAAAKLASLPIAVKLASLPQVVRGFGHVKQAQAAAAQAQREALLVELTRVTSSTPSAVAQAA